MGQSASHSPHRLAAGDPVDHFRVARLIGSGGFGEVYLAHDIKLGRKVALKIISPQQLGSPRAVDRFLFEAKATARFSHPNIVTIYAVGEFEGSPYVALEYLPGQTLRQRLNEGLPGPKEVLRIGRAVAEALVEAHRNNILHRDLKPENILLGADGRPRVLDFGLAKKIAGAPRALPEAQPDPGEKLSPTETQWRRPSYGDDTSPADLDDRDPNRTLPPLGEPAGDDTTLVDQRDSDAFADTIASHSPAGETSSPQSPTANNPTLEAYPSEDDGVIRGTPHYMAPEQWQGRESTPATDIWALGVLLCELLSGRRPFEGKNPNAIGHKVCGDLAPQLPEPTGQTEEILELITACLQRHPSRRPDAAAIARALEASFHRRRLASSGDQSEPFRGLLPFAEEHSAFFYGRDAEAAELVDLLRHTPAVAVVGPSGVGKSSFVYAGLLPRLRDQGGWSVVQIRPGSLPFEALAARMLREMTSADTESQAAQTAEGLASELREHPELLGVKLRQLAASRKRRLLLLVDQLEELFTQVDSADDRHRFMQALRAAADDPADDIRLVTVVRDDFLGRVGDSRHAAAVLSRILVLRALDDDALAHSLTGPLDELGYSFDDPDLPREMVQSVSGEAAQLPMLQFTARLLWEQRDRKQRRLLRQVFERLGGVEGALATHADSVLQSLSVRQLDQARELCLRLVTPQSTRQTRKLRVLLDGLGEEAAVLVDRLVGARLLALQQGADGQATIELAHEALISRWVRLRHWLSESQEDRKVLAEVNQAAQLWDSRGRRPGEVWEGDALTDARTFMGRTDLALPSLLRDFIQAGQQQEQIRHKAIRRRRWRTRAAIASMTLLVFVLLAAWNITLRSKERVAQTQRSAAITSTRALLRQGARLHIDARNHIEAAKQLEQAFTIGDGSDIRALWWQIEQEPVRWSHKLRQPIVGAVFDSRRHRILAVRVDGSVSAIRSSDGATNEFLPASIKARRIALAPDQSLLAIATDSTIILMDIRSGTRRILSRGKKLADRALRFDSQGRWLFGLERKVLRRWPVQRGEAATSVPTIGLFDGRLWPTAKGTFFLDEARGRITLRRWSSEATAPETTLSWMVPQWRAMIAFGVNRSGSLAAHSDAASILQMWHPDRGDGMGSPVLLAEGAVEPVASVLRVAEDGRWIFLPTNRGLALWSAAGHHLGLYGRQQDRKTHTHIIELDPTGQQLLLADRGARMTLYGVNRLIRNRRSGRPLQVSRLWIADHGAALVTLGGDGQVWTWDPARGLPRLVLRYPGRKEPPSVTAVCVSSGSSSVALGYANGVAALFNAHTGQLRARRKLHSSRIDACAISHDGSQLATAARAEEGVAIHSLEFLPLARLTSRGKPSALAFSPSGTRLATVAWGRTTALRRPTIEVFDMVKHVSIAKGEVGVGVAIGHLSHRKLLFRMVGEDLAEIRGTSNYRRFTISPKKRPRDWRSLPEMTRHMGDADNLGQRDLARKAQWSIYGDTIQASAIQLLDGSGKAREVFLGGRAPFLGSQTTKEHLWVIGHAGVNRFSRKTGRLLWHAPLMMMEPLRLYTKQGIQHQGRGRVPGKRWEQNAQQIRVAARSPGGRFVCLQDYPPRGKSEADRKAAELQIWDVGSDRLLRRIDTRHADQLAVDDHGNCAGRERSAITIYSPDDTPPLRVGGSSFAPQSKKTSIVVGAITALGSGFLFGTRDEHIFRLTASGEVKMLHRGHASRRSISALAQAHGRLLTASTDGSVTLKLPAGGTQEIQASGGPMMISLLILNQRMAVGGGLSGQVVFFDLKRARDLSSFQLNGAVIHLGWRNGLLHVATETGDLRTIDMSALTMDRCKLLARMRKELGDSIKHSAAKGCTASESTSPREH